MWTWVDTDAGLRDVVAEILRAPRYALDTEFHRERTYFPELALVQIAWGPDKLALIDPLAVDIALLRPLLESDRVGVLHAAAQDLEVLHQECGAVPQKLFDTQLAAGFVGLGLASLANLYRVILDRQLPKGDRLTDWAARPLTPEQLEYAASDVRWLLEVHDWLQAELAARERTAWFDEETLVVAARTKLREPAPAIDAWHKLKDARSLRGTSRGVACQVAAWREERARRLNLVPRMVMSDLAILAIAQRRPTTEAELQAVRGVDGRMLRGDQAQSVLAAVARGVNGPAPAPPSEVADMVDKRLVPVVPLAQALVAQSARDLGIEVSLLATRADIHRVLQGDESGRLGHGWRAEIVADPLKALVAGRLAVAFDPRGRLVFEPREGRDTASSRASTTPETAVH